MTLGSLSDNFQDHHFILQFILLIYYSYNTKSLHTKRRADLCILIMSLLNKKQTCLLDFFLQKYFAFIIVLRYFKEHSWNSVVKIIKEYFQSDNIHTLIESWFDFEFRKSNSILDACSKDSCFFIYFSKN